MKSPLSRQFNKLAWSIMPIMLLFAAGGHLLAQCIKSSEIFPNQYNTGLSPNINNGTFTGSSGAWTVNSNANATDVVITPYYSPSTTYALKIANWRTDGVSPSPAAPNAGFATATSPVINMISPCCVNGQVMQMTLWTYNVVSGDVNAKMAIDFSKDGGATWNTVFQKTSAQIFIDYGASTKTTITLPFSSIYNVSNFRYRFRGESNKSNSNNFYMFIDDISFYSLASATCTPLTLGNLVWQDINNNGNLDYGEPGIPGISVDLYNSAGSIIQSTITDGNGNYQFNNLSSGTYSVGAILMNGYTKGDTGTTNISADNQNDATTTTNGAACTANFVLSSSSVDIDIALKGILNLGNTVWNDLNVNGLLETGEPGVSGVTVNLYLDNNIDNTPDGGIISTTTTSTIGLYSFRNLGPGNYIVGVVFPDKYSSSGITLSAYSPNGDVDNDNNGTNAVTGGFISNYITLSNGGEPATDGDDNNSNQTLDFALIPDVDRDGVCDCMDIDDDNDGITDLNESGGYDPMGDCDADGIKNYADPTPGCTTPTGNDPWGVPYKALLWTDCNSDGINDFFDWDRDGVINEMDLDSDNDGIVDSREARDSNYQDANNDGMVDGNDPDKNGLMSSAENGNANPILNGLKPTDIDKDGTPNFRDLDSDGDGFTDIRESFLVDLNGQLSLIASTNTGITTGNDADNDGVRNEVFIGATTLITADAIAEFGAKGIVPIDSDGDGIPNSYDIDSDNDGITDHVEGQPTCSYVLSCATDADGDGLMDCLETATIGECTKRSGAGVTPADKDNDGTPDYLDADTDNDGNPDRNEGAGIPGNYVTILTDIDNDGMLDQWDSFNILTASDRYINNVGHNQMGPNGNYDALLPSGSSAKLPKSTPGGCPTTDRDWREVSILPVKLLAFDGNLSKKFANLYWVTERETNVKQYDVERSSDGTNFTKVGTVSASNIALLHKYYFADELGSINGNKIFYRLRIVSKDNLLKFSDLVVFTINLTNAMSIKPNPAHNTCSISVKCSRNQVAPLTVADMTGKMVTMTAIVLSRGNNTINMDELTKLPNGTYVVQIFTETEKLTTQLIIFHQKY